MGKAALIAITGFVVMGAVYSLNANRSALATDERVADYQYETLAKNAAQVAHSRAEQLLSEQALLDTFVGDSFSGEYGGIPYDGEITWTSADDVTIETEAIATDGQGNEVPYQIISKYKKEMIESEGISDEAPRWFQPAFTADGNMNLGGNSDSDIYADGDEADKLNANMHTNSNFSIGGNSDVRGFVTSTGTATVGGNADVEPNYNPSEADPIQEGVASVEIPEFNSAEYLEKMGGADETFDSKEYNANEDYYFEGGTREDPHVIHVQGDLRISGNVEFSGYVMFIVDNYTKISGNVDMGTVDYDGGDESNIAIYTGGVTDIDVTGNTEIYGQIFASGGVNLAGNVDIYGNIATHGALNATGNASIYYRKPSPALTRMWPTEMPQISLVAHNEFSE